MAVGHPAEAPLLAASHPGADLPCPWSEAVVQTGSHPPPHLLLREHGEMSYNYTNKA